MADETTNAGAQDGTSEGAGTDPQAGAAGDGSAGGEGQGQELTFDSWFEGQSEDVRSLVEQHVAGLKAVAEDRKERHKQATDRIRELEEKAEEGSEARDALTNLRNDFENQGRQMAFYEAAAGKVMDLRLAWLAAREMDGVIDDKGNVDLDALKEVHPALFPTKPTPSHGDAGSGTQGGGHTAVTMDDAIRRMAGRG